MHTSVARLAAAAVAVLFILGGCASTSGAVWTYAPVAVSSEAPAAESAAPGQSAAPAESAAPPAGESAAPAGSGAPPAGEARVIDLVATAALQFTTPDGTKVTDIPVTPGETVTFRVDNAAGFDHNFHIGTDAELSVPNAETPDGIPTWSGGVQEFTWVVPADIAGLKFGCTVPGHYAAGMQGTFSLAAAPADAASGDGATAAGSPAATDHDGMAMPASASPGASGAPAESAAPPAAESAAPSGSEAPPAGEGRIIDLVATASLQFTTPDGTQVTDIPVTPGETVTFRVDNTAGFDHNFHIGTDAELSAPNAVTPDGITTWQSGVQEFTWVVPADIAGLKFGCTVPGHYPMMQGTFSVAA